MLENVNQTCTGHSVSAVNPFPEVECRDIETSLTHDVQHNFRLRATFVSQSGGSKTSIVSNRQQESTFFGTNVVSTMELVFDVEKPFHCSQAFQNACEYEEEPAIGVYPDATSVTKHLNC